MNARVLVVEDQLIIQNILTSQLTKLGCRVEVASTGSEAISKAKTGDFQLIFMDYCLPDIDGPDVTKALRIEGIKTPIVAMTGNDDDETRLVCRQSGMNGFLAKPANFEQLSKVIKTFIEA